MRNAEENNIKNSGGWQHQDKPSHDNESLLPHPEQINYSRGFDFDLQCLFSLAGNGLPDESEDFISANILLTMTALR